MKFIACGTMRGSEIGGPPASGIAEMLEEAGWIGATPHREGYQNCHQLPLDGRNRVPSTASGFCPGRNRRNYPGATANLKAFKKLKLLPQDEGDEGL